MMIVGIYKEAGIPFPMPEDSACKVDPKLILVGVTHAKVTTQTVLISLNVLDSFPCDFFQWYLLGTGDSFHIWSCYGKEQ